MPDRTKNRVAALKLFVAELEDLILPDQETEVVETPVEIPSEEIDRDKRNRDWLKRR